MNAEAPPVSNKPASTLYSPGKATPGLTVDKKEHEHRLAIIRNQLPKLAGLEKHEVFATG